MVNLWRMGKRTRESIVYSYPQTFSPSRALWTNRRPQAEPYTVLASSGAREYALACDTYLLRGESTSPADYLRDLPKSVDNHIEDLITGAIDAGEDGPDVLTKSGVAYDGAQHVFAYNLDIHRLNECVVAWALNPDNAAA